MTSVMTRLTILAFVLLALAGCGTSRESGLDWGPWRYDENIASAVSQAEDSAKANLLASRIDCLSVKIVPEDRSRKQGMRELMDDPDDFTTRDRAEIARIVAGIADDGSQDSSGALPKPVNDVLILLFDRTLMSYTCIHAFETNSRQRWSFTSVQYAGAWASSRAESTLSAMGVGHSATR